MNSKLILKLAVLGFALGAAVSAYGQDTGGMRALDVAPTAQANMLGIQPTPVVLVDGQNDGLNLSGNHYVDWQAAVELGKTQYRQLHSQASLGDAARKYRETPRWTGRTWVCGPGYVAIADEHELRDGKDFVHCVTK